MIFAKRVFFIAGVYGILALTPMYFLEDRIGRDFPPPIAHPEHFYGFVGVALAWQMLSLCSRARSCPLPLDDAPGDLRKALLCHSCRCAVSSRPSGGRHAWTSLHRSSASRILWSGLLAYRSCVT